MNMSKTFRIWWIGLCLLFMALPVSAQKFFNLTSDEVKVDSVLPQFIYSYPLQGDYQDSIYTVELKYPEYIDMSADDIAHYNHLSGAILPGQVVVNQKVMECRKKGVLMISLSPLLFRQNRYQALVSFMLDVKAQPLKRAQQEAGKENLMKSRAAGKSASLYADHSVLASGAWAKIRVSQSGIHQLTDAVVRQAGFSNINKVKIYGYGGNLQNEALIAGELKKLDDLQEVPQCIVDGKHYFYAKGPVSWEDKTSIQRIRNPYSDYGYYFITQTGEEPARMDSATFISTYFPQAEDYHSLYEKDGYSWFPGGRNLFDPTEVPLGGKQQVAIVNQTGSSNGKLTVGVTMGVNGSVEVQKNGVYLGTITLQKSVTSDASYQMAVESFATYPLKDLSEKDTITLLPKTGGPMHLDYVAMTWEKPVPFPGFTGMVPAAQYVYGITNQDHHADGAADMVIIIPTSQKLLK